MDAPGNGTYPVTVHYANATSGTSTHKVVVNGDTANPVTVSYAPGDHLWSLVDAGGGYCKIVNKNSGLVLGVQNMSTTTGAQTLQWDDTGTADHLWRITTADGTTPFNS